MVARFNLEDVREEVRSKPHMEGFNDAGLLWLSTREIDDCKLLIRLKFDKARAKDNPRLLALVVIDLNS